MDDFFDIHKQKVEMFNQNFRKRTKKPTKINIPEHLFVKCPHCQELVYSDDLDKNQYICPKCQQYFVIGARKRIELICDENSFQEMDELLKTMNPLDFPGYLEKIASYQEVSLETDAFVSGIALIDNMIVAIGALDSRFMMGSMGSVVGEKVTRLIEHATKFKLPVLIFSASGGARMQEGIFSLMQMVKTSAALRYHHLAGLLYISVLTHPTTGGVAASFASLGDINIAEENALIGFAGQRVIKQTIRQELPLGFQTANFQLEHGMVDLVLSRFEMKPIITKILHLHNYGEYNGE
ncbi:MAG: acetyl-CoA carboxylase, carboxyltransferase subunit beta [Firmicutes bacterium]|nr:acetyl-CoA carboxylase, carboxyltransferase subunit beta [Bacillota bacterium]